MINRYKKHNTHFKSPTGSQAACGLNASYVDINGGFMKSETYKNKAKEIKEQREKLKNCPRNAKRIEASFQLMNIMSL